MFVSILQGEKECQCESEIQSTNICSSRYPMFLQGDNGSRQKKTEG